MTCKMDTTSIGQHLTALISNKLAYLTHHSDEIDKIIICLDNKAYQDKTGHKICTSQTIAYSPQGFTKTNHDDLVLWVSDPVILCLKKDALKFTQNAYYIVADYIADTTPTKYISIMKYCIEADKYDDRKRKLSFIKEAFAKRDAEQRSYIETKDKIVNAVIEFMAHYKEYVQESIRFSKSDVVEFHIPLKNWNTDFHIMNEMPVAAKELETIIDKKVNMCLTKDGRILYVRLSKT